MLIINYFPEVLFLNKWVNGSADLIRVIQLA